MQGATVGAGRGLGMQREMLKSESALVAPGATVIVEALLSTVCGSKSMAGRDGASIFGVLPTDSEE